MVLEFHKILIFLYYFNSEAVAYSLNCMVFVLLRFCLMIERNLCRKFLRVLKLSSQSIEPIKIGPKFFMHL